MRQFLSGACLVGMWLLWPAWPAAAQDAGLNIYVAVEPLQYLVERVGGAHVHVESLVRAGQDPETYEPTLRQIAALSRADAFFGVGMPLEAAWRRRLPGTSSRLPRWTDLSRGLMDAKGRVLEDAGQSDGADAHAGHDPHVWLSPLNARQMASSIADVLAVLDPTHAPRFEANTSSLQTDLETLDREIRAILGGSGVRAFLVFHPAWGYFARTYGLEQIAIESGGSEPGPRTLTEVIRRAERRGIRTVFVDPAHATRLAEAVAAELGGATRSLNPLSYDYMNNLRKAARDIAAHGS